MATVIQDFRLPGNINTFQFYGQPMYGICSTGAATQTKYALINDFTNDMFVTGARVVVQFSSGQTYNGTPKLQINGLTAKSIARASGVLATQYEWAAGAVIEFIYNGTYWVIENGGVASTTYYGRTKLSSSTSDTSTTTAATPSAVKAAYDLADGKAKAKNLTVTLAAANWVANTQTVTASGVTASNTVITTYAPASRADWIAADVYCYAQASNSLTFTCSTTPTSDLTANVLIIS